MICSKCGTQNKEDAKFCLNCRNRLVNQANDLQQEKDIGKKTSQIVSLRIIIIIISAIVITLLMAITIFSFSKTKLTSNNKVNENYSTSFFVQNKDYNYALFDEKGKQLTDFDFSAVSEMIYNTAIVYKDEKVGIISSNGKMVVSFGKYQSISREGSLFKVRKSDDSILINAKDKNIYNLKDMDVHSFASIHNHIILENEKTNKYIVLDSEGKSIMSIPVVDGADKPSTSEQDGFISIFYNNKNYILNINNKKEIVTYANVDHFCIEDVINDEKTLLLTSCASFFKSPSKDSHIVVEDGKVIELDKECDDISRDNERIICESNGQDYFLDNKYKKVSESSYTAFDNNFNYVRNDFQNDQGVNFYKDGKVYKNVPCRSLGQYGYMSNGLFILVTNYNTECGTKSGIYDFYKANGEKAFDKNFESVKKLDKNGYYVVSEDDKNYYLMDEKGVQKSELYTEIRFDGDYYIVKKDSGMGMLDKNGKEIISCEYSNVTTFLANQKNYAKLQKKDSVVIFSLEQKKDVFTSSKDMDTLNYYIEIKDNNKRQLYSYITGKLFYEEK